MMSLLFVGKVFLVGLVGFLTLGALMALSDMEWFNKLMFYVFMGVIVIAFIFGMGLLILAFIPGGLSYHG